jgi:hypothetical protein
MGALSTPGAEHGDGEQVLGRQLVDDLWLVPAFAEPGRCGRGRESTDHRGMSGHRTSSKNPTPPTETGHRLSRIRGTTRRMRRFAEGASPRMRQDRPRAG